MISKSDIKKPNIYIATDLDGMEAAWSALDLARAIEFNPFIGAIYTLEAVYSMDVLKYSPDQVLQDVAVRSEIELKLADLFIIDLRNGDPIELGYAFATGKPFLLYNPHGYQINPVVHDRAVQEVTDLRNLGDLNYLKIMLDHGSSAK